jgi:hypothetical protein
MRFRSGGAGFSAGGILSLSWPRCVGAFFRSWEKDLGVLAHFSFTQMIPNDDRRIIRNGEKEEREGTE